MVAAQPPAEEQRFSDAETASSTGAPNSSLSSASSLPRCSSLSRLSFDCSASSCSPPPPAPAAPRPHRSGDAAWAAIRAASSNSPLGPKDFHLVRRVGGGDIGTVYLCRLRRSTACQQLFAMKVVDRRAAARKKKLGRAAAEQRVLRVLDHPFLPTLFASFDAGPHHSCAVTEFCPGGDLHALRHRMPARRFPLPAARFYAAEVLLALEYLHMIGVVYRDLKPENVLVRADGHVMLTDFDLALQSTTSTLVVEEAEEDEPEVATTTVSCFPDHLLPFSRRSRRRRAHRSSSSRAVVVAEPVDARSGSFVGTHEYVAPEVASGGPHGAAVDWWALGVFLYELIHGRTPFAGPDNEATLRNVVRRPLAFPPGSGSCGPLDAAARDLVARLLVKDPAKRLGSRRGAADVKAHPFFKGVNFALLRSARPPVVPGAAAAAANGVRRSQSCKASTTTTVNKDAGFDLFF